MVDIEKSEKLPREYRYFNISMIWIFYFRWVIRLLYGLRIPHELVTLVSISFGLLSAVLFYLGFLIPAAIALHFKDVFDACDGALARLTGRGNLVGRYVDSLGDFLGVTLVLLAIGLRAAQAGWQAYLFWTPAAIISTFIQCSFFNYYQLAYVDEYAAGTLLSKRDEAHRADLNNKATASRWNWMLKILRIFYAVIYGWQDRLVAYVDRRLFKRRPSLSEHAWYGNRFFMTLVSPLCFGTHIFVLIVFALLGRPEQALVAIASAMNGYLLLIVMWRGFRMVAPPESVGPFPIPQSKIEK
jgi:phosphatidylglycerophosphate synthase